jgi:hypothetical protein
MGNERMTPTLEAIEKAAREATPGEWKAGLTCVYVETGHAAGDPDAPDSRIVSCDDHDAAFIATMSPSVALELVARVRRAEAEREVMARWIVDHQRYVTGARDHACGQCIPDGPLVDPSFVCARHIAIVVHAAYLATLTTPETPR